MSDFFLFSIVGVFGRIVAAFEIGSWVMSCYIYKWEEIL